MVVLRRRTYRAASVPVVRATRYEEPVVSMPDPVYHSHRSRLISNAAMDNSDALSAASKRNDQYLMKEINDRLAHAAMSQPSPVMRRRHSVSRAPSVSRPTSSLSLVTLSKPSAVDSDVNRDVDLMMPMTSRVLRGRSVPPALSRSALVPLYSVPVPAYNKTSVVQNGSALVPLNGYHNYGYNYGYYAPPVQVPYSRYYMERVPIPDSHYYHPLSAARLTPTSDIAVRQAHRDLDRIEHELKTDATLAPPAAPIPTIRTYATMESGPSLRRRTAYYGGPVTGVHVRSASPDYYPTFASASSSTLPYYYSYGAEPLSHYTTPRSYSFAPDSDVLTIKKIPNGEPDYYPSSSTVLYGPALSSSSTVLYGPALSSYSGTISPESAQMSRNIDALLLSSKATPGFYPVSSYVSPATTNVTSYSPVTVPASFSSTPAPPPAVKPQMSQARRRARDVLCRVKNDPKYFD